MCWASVLVSIVLLPIFSSLYTLSGCLEPFIVLLDPSLGYRDMCWYSNRCGSVRMVSIHYSEWCVLNGLMLCIVDGKLNECHILMPIILQWANVVSQGISNHLNYIL